MERQELPSRDRRRAFKPAWGLASIAGLCGRLFFGTRCFSVQGVFRHKVAVKAIPQTTPTVPGVMVHFLIKRSRQSNGCLVLDRKLPGRGHGFLIAQWSVNPSLPGLSPPSRWVSLPNDSGGVWLTVPKKGLVVEEFK